MDAKLTLKLNAEINKEVKLYARETNTSLSKLIENRKVNPVIKSLTGLITLDGKRDHRKAYGKYLTEKYK